MEWAQVLAIVLPIMLTIIIGIIYNNRRVDDLRSDLNQRFIDINQRFIDMNESINQRFADMNELSNQRFIELKAEIREIRIMLVEFLKKEAGV
ncbi:MAG: hypothetical protein GXO75_05050 [Calditrichaeota bacterium]|nr:hypothetical protein [Calditrichota bacterium]